LIPQQTQEGVKTLLRDFMGAWITKQYEELRRIEQEGVSPSGILAPFHDALVPGIRGLGERGFSTALGISMSGSLLRSHERLTQTSTAPTICREISRCSLVSS
jgi:hypothetical protein